MKTILICPSQANGISVLADSKPLVSLPLLGESYVCYWLEHLALRGAREVRLVTSDDVEAVKEVTGSGERWGLQLEIFQEHRELDTAEARRRYRADGEEDWLDEDVIEANHLPGLKEHKLFAGYHSWFDGVALWLPYVCQKKPLGVREIEPGVWVGQRAKIARGARFHAPCWLGDYVSVGKNSVVGPFAFLEDRVVVDDNAEISNSWVGPDTFVGALTRLHQSLAWGDLLINWKNGSHTRVPDPFLMASLVESKKKQKQRSRKKAAAGLSVPLSRPFEAVVTLAQKIQG